ncbi:hypothetical protein SAMN05444411_103185 [Lutibacter oricola]|uniref:CoA-binding domain-containing protein n=1 Tax=Lutibacter oricola TaxID=762486 RepID=A0A1H2Z9X2_9FLAO|nr:CoA-binding protein [Lutibacter oricola]SDX14125.1 hypothetical protein SAMN05444411_103185 [Lutibacter oricola]
MNKKTLVIGASENPKRYSNIAIKRLEDNNIEVKALGRRKGSVNGIDIVTEKINFENIDTVTMYVGPKNQPEFYNYIIGLNPKRVLFNPGTENVTFENLLTENNIEFERACTLVLLGLNEY